MSNPMSSAQSAADAASGEVLLRAEKLNKTYPDGNVRALVDVDLEIRAGEYVSIMGTSGSGKSTLLNMLGALDLPDSGEVYFRGDPLSKHPNLDRFRSETLGFVFQSFHLLPVLTAIENVQIPMFESKLSASERRAKANDLLKLIGMDHRADHLPKKMSVGERQRVAIARALANDPALLLADEPTGNLDSTNAVAVLDLFDRLNQERGLTIVMITHDDDLGQRARRIVRVRDGHVVSDLDTVPPK